MSLAVAPIPCARAALRAASARRPWLLALGLSIGATACSLQELDKLSAGSAAGSGAGELGQAGASAAGADTQGFDAGWGLADEARDGGSTGGSSATAGAGGAAGSDVGVPVNVFINGGFESGSSSWERLGNCTVALSTTGPRSGANCLFVSSRTQSWEGASYNLLGRLTPGERYDASVWVRTAAGSYELTLTYAHRCPENVENVYTPFGANLVTTDWTELAGTLLEPGCGSSTPAFSVLYIEGAPVGEDYYIDDTSLMGPRP